MLARSEQLTRIPRLFPLVIVLLVSLTLWAGLVFGLFMLLELLEPRNLTPP